MNRLNRLTDIFFVFVVLALVVFEYWMFAGGTLSDPIGIMLFVLALAIQIIVIYAALIEPRLTTFKLTKIKSKREVINNLKILLIADLGIGTFVDDDEPKKWIEKINNSKFDLLVICGDLTDGSEVSLTQLDFLKDIKSNAPKLFVPGNHDYEIQRPLFDFKNKHLQINHEIYEKLEQKLDELGIEVLKNKSINLTVNDKEIEIYGLDDLWVDREGYKKINVSKTDNYKVLLCHNPDINQQEEFVKKFDLVLCGHTHGGQVRLPILGPVLPEPIESDQRKFSKGLIEIGNPTTMFITQGLGESGIRMRFFNPPRIDLLEVES
ncbi:metallophosphoesterase [Candidatus Dojkabacteria bacterium]|uniref:Metallophosphoesterase n=1 Tax=Candidatus Dojkabacteria bacterium TaxID=2099670 RepID=A0A955RI98_9BACT|nr:metallophosphoesterase [Candidatus Dojkabacteria bacterium]